MIDNIPAVHPPDGDESAHPPPHPPIPPTHPVLAIVVPRATLPPVVIVPVIVACRTEPASHPVPTAPALHLPVTEPALLQPGEVLGAATGPGHGPVADLDPVN